MSDRKKKAAAEKKRLEEEMEDVKQSAEVRKELLSLSTTDKKVIPNKAYFRRGVAHLKQIVQPFQCCFHSYTLL